MIDVWLVLHIQRIHRVVGVHAWTLKEVCLGLELFPLWPALTLTVGSFAIAAGFFRVIPKEIIRERKPRL